MVDITHVSCYYFLDLSSKNNTLMKRPLFMTWAALRWIPLMFLIAPVMEAPLVAHLSEPVKPLKTWVGNASWYGPNFDGKMTANGEQFDCEALTAAHPNLPFGSIVRFVSMTGVPIKKDGKLMYPIASRGRLA